MARRKTSPNKESELDNGVLTDFVIRDTQLRRLLKAEQLLWDGGTSRAAFRELAQRTRAELRGEAEFKESFDEP